MFAQVFGFYKTCNCVTSIGAGGGGYLDFNVQDSSNSKWVLLYWGIGTALSSSVLGMGMIYITVEVRRDPLLMHVKLIVGSSGANSLSCLPKAMRMPKMG